MLDLKNKEPKIKIFYPLLLHYSPEAAILYGYLQHIQERENILITELKEESYYSIETTRFTIRDETGLSCGQQVDAEMDLLLANLAITAEQPNGMVGYDLFAYHENGLRRFVYKTRLKWNIPA